LIITNITNFVTFQDFILGEKNQIHIKSFMIDPLDRWLRWRG